MHALLRVMCTKLHYFLLIFLFFTLTFRMPGMFCIVSDVTIYSEYNTMVALSKVKDEMSTYVVKWTHEDYMRLQKFINDAEKLRKKNERIEVSSKK